MRGGVCGTGARGRLWNNGRRPLPADRRTQVPLAQALPRDRAKLKATPARENPNGRRAMVMAESLAADPPRRTDARPAQDPLERRAARQPLVARIERPGDAVTTDGATPAETARSIWPAVSRAASNAVGAPRAIRWARHRVPTAQPAETLTWWHARPRSTGEVHVVGTADQSSRTRPRNPGAAPAPIRRARQDLGIDARAAPANREPANHHGPNCPPEASQDPTPSQPAGIPLGQLVEAHVVHP